MTYSRPTTRRTTHRQAWRRSGLATIASTAALVATMAAAPAPAFATGGTVPSMYACSRMTSKCHQTNPPHVNSPGVPNECWWTGKYVYGDGMGTGGCTFWVATPAGY